MFTCDARTDPHMEGLLAHVLKLLKKYFIGQICYPVILELTMDKLPEAMKDESINKVNLEHSNEVT